MQADSQMYAAGGGFGQMSEMIRAKERELQHFQELRNAQLEEMILERDKLLLESSKQQDLLKEDFQYNLTLIDARDREIERLEKGLASVESVRDDLQQQLRTLSMRLESQQQRDADRVAKIEMDKQNSKKVLEELKAVIETLQWNANEDAKSRQLEVDKLRRELSLSYRHKDEALELQRRELTHTFEQIIQQREEAISTREEEIQLQIHALEQRFETLTNDHLLLQDSLRECRLQKEHLAEQLQQREDRVRQLQYQLEDEQHAKLAALDVSQRQIHGLQQSLSREQELRAQEKADWSRASESQQAELLRAQEFRLSLEDQLANQLTESDALMRAMDGDKSQTLRALSLAQTQVQTLQLEKEALLSKWSALRAENESQSMQVREDAVQIERLTAQRDALSIQVQSNEDTMSQLKQELVQQQQRAEANRKSLRNESEEQLRSMRDDLQRQCTEALRERDALRGESVDKDAQISQLQQEVQRAQSQLREEKLDKEAQSLRWNALQQQFLDAQQELRSLRAQQTTQSMVNTARVPTQWAGPRTAAAQPANALSYGAQSQPLSVDVSLPEISEVDVRMSPLLTDDLLAMSLPASPMLPTSSVAARRETTATEPSPADSYFGIAHVPPMEQRMMDENDRLKAVIRQMRQDMESMRLGTPQKPIVAAAPVAPVAAAAAPVSLTEEPRRDLAFQELQDDLKQSRDEIMRLRSERKKLMDAGNALRSQLNRAQPLPLDTRLLTDDVDNLDDHHSRKQVNSTSIANVWDDSLRPMERRPKSAGGDVRSKDESEAHPQSLSPTTSRKDSESILVRGESISSSSNARVPLSIRSRVVHTNPPQPLPVPTRRASISNIPLSNSLRTTNSQAQALQRLRDAQLQRVLGTTSSQDLRSGSETESISRKQGINYAALAKLESD